MDPRVKPEDDGVGTMENLTENVSIAIIAACAAIIGAVIAGIISHYTTKKRNSFEARVEICKYREKWLEQLRHEITEFNTICGSTINDKLSANQKVEFLRHMNKITLLVTNTNEHWPALHRSMGFLMRNLVTGTENSELKSDVEPFLIIAKKILKEEWDEIQDLLHKRSTRK